MEEICNRMKIPRVLIDMTAVLQEKMIQNLMLPLVQGYERVAFNILAQF